MHTTTSFEALFNIEISKSERLRALILIGLLGLEAIFLLVIYFIYSEEYLHMFKTHIAIYAILIFTAIIIVYELLVHYFIGKRGKYLILNSRFFGYFNSFSEVSLLSFLLIFIVEYSNQTIILQAPATLTYFIFIVLSTFRLNFKLSIFTGALSAFEFILISILYSTYFSNTSVDNALPDLEGMQYMGQGLIMVITGIAAGFVADLIKKKMIVSWNNIKEKNEVIDLFGQQISPQIADSIIKNRNELSGTRKKVCIMFLDIRDFTVMAEKLSPEELIAYQNKVFGFMIDTVQEHHGNINQLLGDGFMATFGAPVSHGNDCQNAFSAAQQILTELKERIEAQIVPKTKIGIGLHAGSVVTGNVGSESRKQYSVTGNPVIIASRVEQLNKVFKTQLIITEEVSKHLEERPLPNESFLNVDIKGRTEPIKILKFV